PLDGDSWLEKLLDPQASFLHFDPWADPGGYRAVLAMILADQYQPGLAEKLLNHPGRLIQNHGPQKPPGRDSHDYFFVYGSMAQSRGLTYSRLPEVMDLSQDSLAEVYKTARFKISDDLTVQGTPIAHALPVPHRAVLGQEALEFARLFLAEDLAADYFLPRRRTAGLGLTLERA
ncbi:MAG: hypothetical protein LBK52_06430, partial [Deltaproteobacteria bacterium]|nr:hypothetical protein [Deltaproteobacteria bacterium]